MPPDGKLDQAANAPQARACAAAADLNLTTAAAFPVHDLVVTVMELRYKPPRERALRKWLREYTQMHLSKGKNRPNPEKPQKNGKGGVAGLVADVKFYRPSDKEPFMNERQREAKETLQHLQDESQNHPDLADRASSETDRAIELRARDRQRKLIAKIDAALQRIEDGTYGYCEETGEPITLKRLEARPIATLSIEAQERHERRERVYRDD